MYKLGFIRVRYRIGYTIPRSSDGDCRGPYPNHSVLVRHYGLTEEGLDFIPSITLRAGINDIKYRMGRKSEGEEER